MDVEIAVERLFATLITGDRNAARGVVTDLRTAFETAEELTTRVYWPVLEMISQLYRADQLSTLAHHYATRLLRSLVDLAQAGYRQQPSREQKILMFSGHSESDELAGQLVADLLEAAGYAVLFGGGGVANDEVLGEVGEQHPDILLMFAAAPSDAPGIRQMIDEIRDVGACPGMQIVVGGGIFNRAEGLAEEIGADLWAKNPVELLERLQSEQKRRATPGQRTVGRNRRNGRSQAVA